MSEPKKIALTPNLFVAFDAIRVAYRAAGQPVPSTASGVADGGERSRRIRALVDLGCLRVAETGGRGAGKKAMVEPLPVEVEVAEGKAPRGSRPRKARTGADGLGSSASVRTRPRSPAPANGDEISPLVAGVEAAIHGLVAEVLGGFAKVAGALGGGLRTIQGSAEKLTTAVATGDGAERIAALEHLVGELRKSRDAALRDRDVALSIAGRARVQAETRETPAEIAARTLRSRGSDVVRASNGAGWIVNGAPKALTDAKLIERAARPAGA